jgi:hypothetical protein
MLRVETDAGNGSAYEAHVRKSNGTEVEVLVNRQFEVTAVKAFGGPDAPPATSREALGSPAAGRAPSLLRLRPSRPDRPAPRGPPGAVGLSRDPRR